MKKKISIIMTLVLSLFLIVGCGKADTPTKVAENFFSDVKAGTNSEFGKEALKKKLTDTDTSSESATAMLDMLARMESEVVGETIDGDNATVEMKVKAVSLKTVMGSYLQKIMQYAMTAGNLSQEEKDKKVEEILIECIKDAELEERTGNINLTKEDDKWVVSTDDALQNLVFDMNAKDTEKLAE